MAIVSNLLLFLSSSSSAPFVHSTSLIADLKKKKISFTLFLLFTFPPCNYYSCSCCSRVMLLLIDQCTISSTFSGHHISFSLLIYPPHTPCHVRKRKKKRKNKKTKLTQKEMFVTIQNHFTKPSRVCHYNDMYCYDLCYSIPPPHPLLQKI
uniref:WGS project CAEQ00000000 data, annotated contig 322 n=1 Tax=Trypanosoma congolense (strain IL3000) TaxID=1068625 RepID=F9WEW8_TRYCI|nr:unnamed protein product [Trypanosoma congolense IL3000]